MGTTAGGLSLVAVFHWLTQRTIVYLADIFFPLIKVLFLRAFFDPIIFMLKIFLVPTPVNLRQYNLT